MIDKKKLPEGAIECATVTVPGYYWWLPTCALSLEASEWQVVDFHPNNGKTYSGWFVGPLKPPKPCVLYRIVVQKQRKHDMQKLAREKARQLGVKVSAEFCQSPHCRGQTPLLVGNPTSGWKVWCPNCGQKTT